VGKIASSIFATPTSHGLDSVSRAELLLYVLLRGFAQVSGLNVFMNTDKGFFEGVKGRRVQHFLLDLGAE